MVLVGLLVSVFLLFEARRYLYFNVWRARARLLETNFYAPMISGEDAWIFIIQAVAYYGKLAIHPAPLATFADLLERAAIGPIPGGLIQAGPSCWLRTTSTRLGDSCGDFLPWRLGCVCTCHPSHRDRL